MPRMTTNTHTHSQNYGRESITERHDNRVKHNTKTTEAESDALDVSNHYPGLEVVLGIRHGTCTATQPTVMTCHGIAMQQTPARFQEEDGDNTPAAAAGDRPLLPALGRDNNGTQ